MKTSIATLIFAFSASNLFSQDISQNFITYDIDNFWTAYDKIITTKEEDSIKQYDYLNETFIDKIKPVKSLRSIMPAQRNSFTFNLCGSSPGQF